MGRMLIGFLLILLLAFFLPIFSGPAMVFESDPEIFPVRLYKVEDDGSHTLIRSWVMMPDPITEGTILTNYKEKE